MALMEVQVSGEMIAIIGAAVALGVGMFGSTRWIHKDVERLRADMGKLDSRLSADMGRLDSRLSANMGKLDSRLSANMGKLDSRLSGEIRESEGRLRGEMHQMGGRLDSLRDEMTTGFREVADRLTDVGDRLSRVEGVIEGMALSARYLSPDTPKEGAA